MPDSPAGNGNLFDDLVEARLGRRELLGGSLGAAALGFLNGCGLTPGAAGSGPLIGFTSIPISRADTVIVPEGYTWQVVNAWGDPIMAGAPAFKTDASQSAAEQAMQSGMFHDGMHYFPLPKGSASSTHGLIGIKYEYTDDNLLTTDGMAAWSAEKVQKSKNAHGLGVYEARFEGGRWRTVADSRYGRRITAASTPSSWTRAPTSRCGPSATTASSRTSSRCRTRSRARSPRRCASRRRRRSRRRWRRSRPTISRPTISTCAAGATPAAGPGRISSSRSRCSRTPSPRTRTSRSPTPRSRTSAPTTTRTTRASRRGWTGRVSRPSGP